MTPISQLQEDVGQRLADELPKYTGGRVGWSIVTEVKGDIENKVRLSLNKIGIGIAVFTPTWVRGDMEDRRDAQVIVSVVETQIINMSNDGMRFPGIDLCWLISGILHGFQPSPWSVLRFLDCKLVDGPFQGSNHWDVTFETSGVVMVEDAEFDEKPIEQEPLSK